MLILEHSPGDKIILRLNDSSDIEHFLYKECWKSPDFLKSQQYRDLANFCKTFSIKLLDLDFVVEKDGFDIKKTIISLTMPNVDRTENSEGYSAYRYIVDAFHGGFTNYTNVGFVESLNKYSKIESFYRMFYPGLVLGSNIDEDTLAAILLGFVDSSIEYGKTISRVKVYIDHEDEPSCFTFRPLARIAGNFYHETGFLSAPERAVIQNLIQYYETLSFDILVNPLKPNNIKSIIYNYKEKGLKYLVDLKEHEFIQRNFNGLAAALYVNAALAHNFVDCPERYTKMGELIGAIPLTVIPARWANKLLMWISLSRDTKKKLLTGSMK